MKMDISFIIPNFNGENLLKKNLPKIVGIAQKYKNGKSEIIVTDDSSKDNSLTFLEHFAEENKTVTITLLKNTSGKNKGFSSNVNKGVNAAKGDIVILLNTDVVPNENFLAPLLSHFEDKDVFAVGCIDESIENGKTVFRGRGIGRWYKGFLIHKAGTIGGLASTLWVSGGSGAFRKALWDKLGGLNELYNPFYWEDIDLSYRAQKAGYRILFEEKSVVRHEHETGSIKKNYSSFAVKKTAYRNQFFFTWLNATDTIILVEHAVFVPYFLLRALLRGDSAFILGYVDAVLQFPKVWSARQRVQELVTKSDRDIIAKLSKEI